MKICFFFHFAAGDFLPALIYFALQFYYVVYGKKILWKKIVKSGAVAGGRKRGASRQV
jgi:hypothetical protein